MVELPEVLVPALVRLYYKSGLLRKALYPIILAATASIIADSFHCYSLVIMVFKKSHGIACEFVLT